ncbi:flavodoxin [Pycnococcus provasolii]
MARITSQLQQAATSRRNVRLDSPRPRRRRCRFLVCVAAQKNVGVFYTTGSRTTLKTAEKVVALLNSDSHNEKVNASIVNVRESQDFEEFECLVLGMPSYKWGEDPNEFPSALEFDTIQPPPGDPLDLMGKKCAMFGTGDRVGYGDYYIEGLARVWRMLDMRGATLVGKVDASGFEEAVQRSRAIVNGKFLGLPVDDNDEPEEREAAIEAWVAQVVSELE